MVGRDAPKGVPHEPSQKGYISGVHMRHEFTWQKKAKRRKKEECKQKGRTAYKKERLEEESKEGRRSANKKERLEQESKEGRRRSK